jgi:ribosomal protein S18 acetylase RimI-like enzyme
MIIRRAGEQDAVDLASFAARTFREAFEADNNPNDFALFMATTYSPELQRAEILNSDVDTLLAIERDTLIGFVQIRIGNPPSCVTHSAPVELQRMYVDRTWHGKGVADQLMTASKESARARGGKHLWLGVWERNTRAQSFYRRCGFEKVGTHFFVVGNDPQIDHVMVCPLVV